MAFFGLTALGPQEMYRAAREDAYDLTLFELPEASVERDSRSPSSGSLSPSDF
jgi:hypothetical protein